MELVKLLGEYAYTHIRNHQSNLQPVATLKKDKTSNVLVQSPTEFGTGFVQKNPKSFELFMKTY